MPPPTPGRSSSRQHEFGGPMATLPDTEATARDFAELFLDRSFDAAAELVAER